MYKTRVMVCFCLVSNDCSTDIMTTSIRIEPTKVWVKESFRLPEHAGNKWLLSSGYQVSKGISDQFEQLIVKLADEVDAINLLRSQYKDLSCFFEVVIQAFEQQLPEMILSRSCISFAASLDAEIGFDMYIYEPDEECGA